MEEVLSKAALALAVCILVSSGAALFSLVRAASDEGALRAAARELADAINDISLVDGECGASVRFGSGEALPATVGGRAYTLNLSGSLVVASQGGLRRSARLLSQPHLWNPAGLRGGGGGEFLDAADRLQPHLEVTSGGCGGLALARRYLATGSLATFVHAQGQVGEMDALLGVAERIDAALEPVLDDGPQGLNASSQMSAGIGFTAFPGMVCSAMPDGWIFARTNASHTWPPDGLGYEVDAGELERRDREQGAAGAPAIPPGGRFCIELRALLVSEGDAKTLKLESFLYAE